MDTRSIRTKNALAESLRELMLTNKFDKISVEQICNKAGLTRRNFYRHFMDKRDLLGYIYEQDFDYDFSEHPDWTIYDYVPYFSKNLYAHRQFYIKAYSIEGQNSLREYCLNWLYPLLHRDSGQWYDSPEIEHRILKVTCYATFDAFVDWLSQEPCMTPEEFTKLYLDTIVRFNKHTNDLVSRLTIK